METFITSWQENLVENNHWGFDNNLAPCLAPHFKCHVPVCLSLSVTFYFFIMYSTCCFMNMGYTVFKFIKRCLSILSTFSVYCGFNSTENYFFKLLWSRQASWYILFKGYYGSCIRRRIFPEHTVCRLSHYQLFGNDMLSLLDSLEQRWEWSVCLVSREHGRQPSLSVGLPILTPWSTCPHWSMAEKATARTIEKGPLSRHSWRADPALTACHSSPLKAIVPCYSQILKRTHPNGPCQFDVHFFLSTISSFPLRGQGISQKEMPALQRSCLFSLSLTIVSDVILFKCRVLITRDNKDRQ